MDNQIKFGGLVDEGRVRCVIWSDFLDRVGTMIPPVGRWLERRRSKRLRSLELRSHRHLLYMRNRF